MKPLTTKPVLYGTYGLKKESIVDYVAIKTVIEVIATTDPTIIKKLISTFEVNDPDGEICNQVLTRLVNYVYLLENLKELPTVSIDSSNSFIEALSQYLLKL